MAARYRFLPWVRLGASPTAPDPLGPTCRPGPRCRSRCGSTNVTTSPSPPASTVPVTSSASTPARSCAPTHRIWRASSSRTTSRSSSSTDPTCRGCSRRPPATRAGKLRPWIVLVVVRRQPGVSITVDAASRRPVLRIAEPARPADELPEPRRLVGVGSRPGARRRNGHAAGRPARCRQHAQPLPAAVPSPAGRRHGVRRLRRAGIRGRSPRRPRAGRSTTADEERLGAGVAQRRRRSPRHRPARALPLGVQHRRRGRLRDVGSPAHAAPGAAASPGRPLSVRGLGFGIPDLGIVQLGGVLRPVGATGRGTAAVDVRHGAADRARPARQPGSTGSRPIRWSDRRSTAAARRPHSTIDRAPPWMASINLDPRLRAFAGLGVAVVQEQQEHLMAAAWEQLGLGGIGDPRAAPAGVRRGRAAPRPPPPRRPRRRSPRGRHRAGDVPRARRRAGSGAAPRRRRSRCGAVLADSRTPSTVLSAAFRRAVRPRGPLMRRAATATGGVPTRAGDQVRHPAGHRCRRGCSSALLARTW